MHLVADTIYVEPKEDDSPFTVGFHDRSADYCLILSRFSDMTPDRGTINVMVRDQIHTETANVTLTVSRSQCLVRLDKVAAAELLGNCEYTVDFHADDHTYALMVQYLRAIFQGLSGLTVVDNN